MQSVCLGLRRRPKLVSGIRFQRKEVRQQRSNDGLEKLICTTPI